METVKTPPEQKVILHNVSWETYERLMEERGESRVPRFAYDLGELEIMSPQAEHESISHVAALLVEVLAEEVGLDVYGLGSTTFKREDIERGFEPDQCFYVENWEFIRGKARLDLTIDPPPELVVEVDITNPSLNKLPIYARFGVPEVWRYDGERISIYGLRDARYVELAKSIALPIPTSAALSKFVSDGLTVQRRAWMRQVREWARSRIGPSS